MIMQESKNELYITSHHKVTFDHSSASVLMTEFFQRIVATLSNWRSTEEIFEIAKLPVELQCCILQEVETNDLLNCRRVSKQLKEAADLVLRTKEKSIFICRRNNNSERLWIAIKMYSGAKCIHFVNPGMLSEYEKVGTFWRLSFIDVLLLCKQHLKNVTEMSIEDTCINEFDWQFVSICFPNIKKLRLTHLNPSDEYIPKFLQSLSHLQTLIFSFLKDSDGRCLEFIPQTVEELLIWHRTRETFFLDFLPHNMNVKSFGLNVHLANCQLIADLVIPKMPEIEYLDINAKFISNIAALNSISTETLNDISLTLLNQDYSTLNRVQKADNRNDKCLRKASLARVFQFRRCARIDSRICAEFETNIYVELLRRLKYVNHIQFDVVLRYADIAAHDYFSNLIESVKQYVAGNRSDLEPEYMCFRCAQNI
ncbi:hypothetical protein B4U80_14042 [Leptotrombidium deliense]|uniref:F-box domain-containing protein n=1 Tax=Leptotrombidium deliense TaxID=299467 RepID=A0A443S4G5_9ACAR|nr:hypothetical protein B4U80_14042 [Leptotrombidium deliense]